MSKKNILIFLATVGALLSQAQAVTLTLPQAIDSAMANNRMLAITRVEEDAAVARYQQTQAVYLPQVQVSYTAMSTTNPLNAFGFNLQQETITQADFNPEVLNDPAATQNFMTRFSVQQPILNLDLINMRQAAALEREVYASKSKRTREYLVFEVSKAYAQAQLAQQQQQVAQEALATVKAIYASTQQRFEKGFLQKSDLLQVEVQLINTQRQLEEASSAVNNAQEYLALLTGITGKTKFQLDEAPQQERQPSGATAVPEARADFQAMHAAIEAQGKMVKSAQFNLVPRVNAFGEYQINDREVFGFGANSYLVGAQLSWSIFNGLSTRNKVAEHKLTQQKLQQQLMQQKEQDALELNKTLRQIEVARLSLQQSTTAVDQAAEALRILRNRYDQGLVATMDLLQSQTLLAQQRLQRAASLFQLNTAIAYQIFLTTSEK